MDAEPLTSNVAAALVGRAAELEMIRTFVADAAEHGGALLLSGEPGVGKTVLLDAAAESARAVGVLVLRASGAELLADLSLSGVNRILVPLRGGLERLSAAHREALSVLMRLGPGPTGSRLLVVNAVLALLREAAIERPVLVVIDDLHCLDRASAVALAFVARRLDGSRAGFIGASRTGVHGFFERAGLPEHEVVPLDEQAAASLIGTRFPMLAARVSQRLLAEAAGNPLALLELPEALSEPQRSALRSLPQVLPLGRRLQALFASRLGELPQPTRRLLLFAALQGTDDLSTVQAASSRERGLDDLSPAERAQLVTVDRGSGRVIFRHPLVRSTIVELSTSGERHRTHRVLAELLVDQPERRAWHLADATTDPDEHVADLLHRTSRAGAQ